jgi:hypothetical protein
MKPVEDVQHGIPNPTCGPFSVCLVVNVLSPMPFERREPGGANLSFSQYDVIMQGLTTGFVFKV